MSFDFVDTQGQSAKARQDHLECDGPFQPRERSANAEMVAKAESQMDGRRAINVETIGFIELTFVPIRRAEKDRDHRATRNRDARDLDGAG